jgi:hypothetical protein
MNIFYPACPKCGGKTCSAESTNFEAANKKFGLALWWEAVHGHPHPYLKIARVAIVVGRELYKRVPGGGTKRCKNVRCSHEFH